MHKCLLKLGLSIANQVANFVIVLIMEQEMEIWSCNQSIEKRKTHQISAASASRPAGKNHWRHARVGFEWDSLDPRSLCSSEQIDRTNLSLTIFRSVCGRIYSSANV